MIMSSSKSKTPDFGKIVGTGLMIIPSIGIPYLFGLVAFKALGFLAQGAGLIFNQAKNVVSG